jgi:imidazolonepropionase-like amidohydrolase
VSAGVDVISHSDQLVWEAMPDADPGPRQLAMRWLEEDVRRVAPDHPAILALLKRMTERGTILDATVSLYQASIRSVERESPQYVPVVKATAAFASAVTRTAHEMGVEVCTGTDGIFESGDAPLPALHREMAVLVEDCGFTPAEALIAATRVSARALGISKTHGTIGPGMAADLVILQADPTADIHNSSAIELVIKSGRPVPREGGRQPLTDR